MRASNPLVTIRSATPEDLARLSEFAGEFLARMHAKSAPGQAVRVFQHVMNQPNAGLIVVAAHQTGICAYAYGAYEWRSEFGGESMDVVELFVEPQWRNKGVAARLIEALLDSAKQRGIRHVSAQVHPGNAAIERILESAGLDPQQRTVWGVQL